MGCCRATSHETTTGLPMVTCASSCSWLKALRFHLVKILSTCAFHVLHWPAKALTKESAASRSAGFPARDTPSNTPDILNTSRNVEARHHAAAAAPSSSSIAPSRQPADRATGTPLRATR